MRTKAFALAMALVACTAPPPVTLPGPTPTRDPSVFAVTALLDLSGRYAAVGSAQQEATRRYLDQRQGDATPRIQLDVIDTAGSGARLLIELRRAAVERGADALIIGVPTEYDDVLGRAIDLAAIPVLFTLPLDIAEPVAHPGGRWAFALAPSLAQLAAAAIDDATARGVVSPALVLTRDAIEPDAQARAIRAESSRRGREIDEIALPADGAVPPFVRSSLSVLGSVHCFASIPACAAVAREARASFAPALFYLSYLVTPAEIDDHPELAERAVWPAARAIVPPIGPSLPASSAAVSAFDALTLLSAAIRPGATNAEGARAALERLSMGIIATSFEPQRHAGFRPSDLALVRWTGSGIAAAPDTSLGTGVPTPTPSPTLPASPAPSPSPSPSP